MTDAIFCVILHGPLGAAIGYGATEAEAREYAVQAVKAQALQVKRDREKRQREHAERVRQWSG